MNSFETELQTLIEVWRNRGMPLADIISALDDESEDLQEREDMGER